MIYISTGGCKKAVSYEVVKEFSLAGIFNFELSGGQYAEDSLEQLIKFKSNCNFKVHNYFPPPRDPFVINLASLNKNIYEASMMHVRTAIDYAVALNSTTYSFHAGFLLDPKVSELGKVLGSCTINDRERCLEIFIKRVNWLSQYAEKRGIQLLIENNVVSSANFFALQQDPLLMTTPEECRYVMQRVNANVGFLLDVAHLKVSAVTLGYDPFKIFSLCNDWIQGYHLSDNNGMSDSNEPIRKDSWFWPHIKKDLDYYTVEVYNLSPKTLLSQKMLIEEMFEFV